MVSVCCTDVKKGFLFGFSSGVVSLPCRREQGGMLGAYSKPQRLTKEDKVLFEAVVTPEFGYLKPRRISYQVVAALL